MSSLKIARNFGLPLEAVTQTFAILAKRGAGKSYTASVMVEEMLDNGLLPVVLDPLGVWWGLQSSSDGKREGYPITVLGGDHGNVPLEATAGTVIADFVVSEQHPVVLDLSHFNKADQIRFSTAFAERLYQKNRDPLHLVVDEADLFAPQSSPRGYEARMLGSMEDLARRGRARGIGMTLVTQRSAVLNKNVLTQIEVLVVMRTTSPQDRKAIKAWVDVHGEEETWMEMNTALPKLPIGVAYVWSPGWLDTFKRVEIRKRSTFDSSATPKVGQRRVEPKRRAEVDLDALRDRMAETIERAKKDDPAHLRREITRLESELAKKPEMPEPPEPEVVEVFPSELRSAIENDVVGEIRSAGERLVATADKLAEDLANMPTDTPRDVPKARETMAEHQQAVGSALGHPGYPGNRRAQRPEHRPSTDNGSLSKAARVLLETLVAHSPMKMSRAQVSTLSGYKPRSSTFANALSELNTKGLIEKDGAGRGAFLSPSQEGFDMIGAAPKPQTPGEIQQTWLSSLPQAPSTMLSFLIGQYPSWVDREKVSEETGYSTTSSTFANALSTLRTNGLLEDGPDRLVRATETLFL